MPSAGTPPLPSHRPVGASTVSADNIFPKAAVDYLNQLADAQQAEAGGIVRSDASPALSEHVRRSEITWVDDTPASRPIFGLIAQFVSQANDQVFHLELSGFSEPFQIATYRATDQGFYGWHLDIGAGRLANRKLSLIVPLTDPSQYEGGQLELFFDHQPTAIDLPLGRIVAFPSYVLHRVTPVTRGVRRTLAIWVSGPPFR